jgi:hypothetical protein
MPCQDESTNSVAIAILKDKDIAVKKIKDAYEKLVDKHNNLTRLLCEACSYIYEDFEPFEPSAALNKWYNQHQKKDKVRLRREALAKLSKEEKRALGF